MCFFYNDSAHAFFCFFPKSFLNGPHTSNGLYKFLKVKLELFTSFLSMEDPILALASLPHVSTWHKSHI